MLQNLHNEQRKNLSILKNLCIESKELVSEATNIKLNEYVKYSQIEEKFHSFEIKLTNLYTEMQHKDKYINMIDYKYDMINEENKFLKAKLKEDKQFLLNEIQQFQIEETRFNENLISNLKKEVEELKTKLEDKYIKDLENSELTINNIQEKKDILLDKIESLSNYLNISNAENRELRQLIHERNIEISNLKDHEELSEEEREYLLKSSEEQMKKSLNEEKAKVAKLELSINSLEKKLEDKNIETRKIISEYEKNKQTIIDKLKENNSDIQKKHRESIMNLDTDKMKYLSLIKIKDDDIESNSLLR